jgi:hypothetical protein
MDQFNWLVAEYMVRERAQQATSAPHTQPERPAHPSLRRTLATSIVRLGLRLDPRAGEPLARALVYGPEGRH